MNAFYQHHQDNIAFAYRCFDRILLNDLVQPFQQPERVIGFFNTLSTRTACDAPSPDRYRRPVPRLDHAARTEVGRADRGRSRGPPG